MRPFLLYIISAIALFSSCNWVNDDLSDCPSGTWLKISYTYNILDVDAASTQVSDITILAFDKDDKYVDRVDVDSITLHQGYCMVRVPFPEGTYRLLIWGGTSNHMYQLPNLKAGQTERRSLNISLACDNKNQSNKKLNALFYSSLENITISQKYQVITANLVKDTNYFSCILQDEANAPSKPRGLFLYSGICQRNNRLHKHTGRYNSSLLSSIPEGSGCNVRANSGHPCEIKYITYHERRSDNLIDQTYTKRPEHSSSPTHSISVVIQNLQ